MKKNYIQPNIKVRKITFSGILASTTINSNGGSTSGMKADSKSAFNWSDDDIEEE